MIREWVSVCANAAILQDQGRGFLVFGVEDRTHKRVRTTVRLKSLKRNGECPEKKRQTLCASGNLSSES